ncbi:hypothetical protein DFH07DRAFT_1060903 [Mycena maculata]|uniref:Uncharacterized protein n=1 Tax=Mycena maculata TaxID=230809 RepID=A0AAD7J336_9AGAR|nr:hypothetical protein DFH07DRAFT_1060903 [Mycena maculata]
MQISPLQSTVLLALLSLIANDAVRYTLLALTICGALVYTVHLGHPSTQLRHLEDNIIHTEEMIRDAKSHCARDVQVGLMEQSVRLLDVKRTASMIQCRVLKSNTRTLEFNVMKFRLLSRDIAACAKDVKNIQTTAQLMVETERQNRYMEDIYDAEAMLAARCGRAEV